MLIACLGKRIREMAAKIDGWMKADAQKKAVALDLGGILVDLNMKKSLTIVEALDL